MKGKEIDSRSLSRQKQAYKLKKGRRAGYGFVYSDWDLIEIRFNTD